MAAHTPESEQLGITSFVYRAERPFHPERLWQAVAEGSALPPVLRSKGFFWVAARPLLVWQWSTAGSLARTKCCTRLPSVHLALSCMSAGQKPLRQLYFLCSGLGRCRVVEKVCRGWQGKATANVCAVAFSPTATCPCHLSPF